MRETRELVWAASQPFDRAAPARASKTPGPGPRERRRVWPPICLEGVSQRLPQPVGGRGALPSRSHTLAKVRALRRLCCQGNRLQFTIAASRERAAGNGSVSRLDILNQKLRCSCCARDGIPSVWGSECDAAAKEPAEFRVVQRSRKRCTFLELPSCSLKP